MPVRRALVAASLLLLGVLAVAHLGPGDLPPVAWLGALGGWLVLGGWVASAAPATGLGPADLVTLGRGAMACAAAGLVLAAVLGNGDSPHPVLFPLAVLVLTLDAVDGRVARRTGTVSVFGGRFDGETDAFVMLVLSTQVALQLGWWVLVLGLLRYGFGVAGALLPWLRAALPFRWWRKVVTAAAGIALVAAVPDLLPEPVAVGGLVVAAGLLVESFGRDVLWCWRQRVPARLAAVGPPP